MASFKSRGINIRGPRSQRRRHDSIDETVTLDFNRDPAENLRDILVHVVKKEGVTKARKLAYLNCLVKLSAQTDFNDVGFSKDEIFCCLRVALSHEAPEVRAGALRALRYLLRDQSSVEALCRAHIHWFIARSLDIILDNRVERVHALRLARKILCTCPKLFPRALVNCLVAVASDGADERDSLLRACLGTLCELVLLNPELCRDCDVLGALSRAVLDCPHAQVSEAILGVILILINKPESRIAMGSQLSIHHLMAPLTDAHYKHSSADPPSTVNNEVENRMKICRLALSSVLHSWQGLLYFCHHDHYGVQTIVEMLYLPFPNTRREILLLLFDIFSLSVPEWTSDFGAALLSCDSSASLDSWQLYEGFVADEGKDILPHVAKYRTNLVENYLALLLLVFVNQGALEALVDVVTTGDKFISIQATILLGELLHLCSQLLPPDFNHHCQFLPTLISMATSNEISAHQRNKANSAINLLERLHVSKRRNPIPCSLFLDQLLQFTSPGMKKKGFFRTIIGRTPLVHYLKRDTDYNVIQVIRDTQVSQKKYTDWDWDLIGSILRSPGEVLKRLEDTACKNFISTLIDFYKPYSKDFPQLKQSDQTIQEICTVGCQLIDFLLEADETRAYELILDFLSELNRCFSEIASQNEKSAGNTDSSKQYYVQNGEEDFASCTVLRPSNIVNTGQYYFLFLGRLSNSNKGRKWLEKTELFQHMMEIVGYVDNDIYVKLIVSSLDYTTDGFSRILLTKVLTASSNSCRLYATNYLRVLLRASILDFRKWAIELLVTQLYDKSRAVSLGAADILDEACEIPENLEALISLRPSLLHIGDKGLLLILRFLSVPSGFNFLRDANFINHELNKWNTVNNLKYVKIVEDSLNEAITRHRRGADGTYGRHSSNIRHRIREAFIPSHMYGQLAQHNGGVEFLLKQDCLAPQYQRIKCPTYDTDGAILQLKAALWAVGHVGSTPLGFPLIQESDVIFHLVKMAADCPVISVRGVCFYVLGLLSSTPDGADALAPLGWEAVRHNRQDRWPLIPQPEPLDLSHGDNTIRHGHTWSVSSFSSQVSDWLTRGLMRGNRRREDSESSNPVMDTVTEEEAYPGLGRSRSCYNEHEEKYPRERTFTTYKEYPHHHQHSPVGIGVNTLPRNIKFSPHHQLTTTQPRPRSSSDGQSETRTNGSESVGCVPPSRSVTGFLSSSHNSGTGEDRTGGICRIEPVVTREERSESNDSAVASTKSRSGSCTDSTTSGVSSCDSNSNRTSHVEHAQRLSPIPSSTSLNTLVSRGGVNSVSDVMKPPVGFGQALPSLQKSSTVIQSPTSPLGFPMSFSYTSARDALGYTTWRAIQRRRTQSFGDEDDVGLSYQRRNSKAHSLDPGMDTVFFIGESGDASGHAEETSRRSSIESHTLSIFSRRASETGHTEDIRYTGLCLPQNTDSILRFPVDPAESKIPSIEEPTPHVAWIPHTSKEEESKRPDGLDLHTECLCLMNHSAESPVDLKTNSVTRTPDKRIVTKENKESNVVNLRREVLRLITNLSSSIGSQQWEKGLLSLKQKFPQAFHDICLYSELCLQMEHFRFRLATRRFLQEVFLDIKFDQLYLEAEAILFVHPTLVTLPCPEESDT